ncbi:MAG TPA: ABC transporter ATP-binding protein [Candidatus Latescibacteria bacterium]|nr:ABC transporter ATP-binding protein [Candidatus Latescibacterota bacterium]
MAEEKKEERVRLRDSLRQTSRLLRGYLLPHWTRMMLVLATAFGLSLSPYIFGFMSKIMIDKVLEIRPQIQQETLEGETSQTAPPAGRPMEERMRLLWWMFLAYVLIRLTLAGLRWLYSYNITYVGQKLVFRLRQELYDKLQRIQISFFDRQQVGKIMARVFDDVDIVQYSVSHVFVQLLQNMGMLAIGVVLLMHLNIALSAIALATLPFYAVAYRLYRRKVRPINRAQRERNSEMYAVASQAISGIRVVKSFAQEPREERRFFHKAAEVTRLLIKRIVLGNTLGAASGIISVLGTQAVFYLGARKIQAGELSYGTFAQFMVYVASLFSPMVRLSNMNAMVQWVSVALKRVFNLLDEEITIKDRPGAVELEECKGHIVFDHVWLKYEGAEDCALKDITFEVSPGTIVALVGPSGSGKTSLVNLLLRLYDPSKGRIILDGHDLRDIKLSSLRRYIRMVPQEPILFSGTIAENIAYGRPGATPSQIVEAAKAAELHNFIMSLPDKYESEVEEAGANLSGGQKQRMAIAMALLTDPSVLILDDSTSALDAETEARIQQTLDRVMVGRTCFIITHRMSTARKADLILVLKDGWLIEMGSHDELMAKGGMYAQVFHQQLAA